MRAAAFILTLGLMGCATTGSPTPTAPAKPAPPPEAAPGKPEVVVIGKGPSPIPGVRYTDQETEFTIYHGKPYRCTKVKGSPENPKGEEWCRDLSSGNDGNPDTGLIDRGSKNIRR